MQKTQGIIAKNPNIRDFLKSPYTEAIWFLDNEKESEKTRRRVTSENCRPKEGNYKYKLRYFTRRYIDGDKIKRILIVKKEDVIQ